LSFTFILARITRLMSDCCIVMHYDGHVREEISMNRSELKIALAKFGQCLPDVSLLFSTEANMRSILVP